MDDLTSAAPHIRSRFSRLGPVNDTDSRDDAATEALHAALALAMMSPAPPDSAEPSIPAGFTYLGQLVDHDLTMDATGAPLGVPLAVGDLVQGRAPVLDLETLYGRGPLDPSDSRFYEPDGAHLRTGRTWAVAIDATTGAELDGYDLPRAGHGFTRSARRIPVVPDPRDDENLAVAQVHAAFIRFHNRVVDLLRADGTPGLALFDRARDLVVAHYQWMLRTDFLPRILEPAVLEDVFTYGRRFVDVPGGTGTGSTSTMPVEFSMAAYRMGHAMVRNRYEWNRYHSSRSKPTGATLQELFAFTGTSGTLSPDSRIGDPDTGSFERLPTDWIVDMRRLFDFAEAGRADLAGPGVNLAKRIDTLLSIPLANLPAGAIPGQSVASPDAMQRNLAFRNLTRARMVGLASGQQMARALRVSVPLTAKQILTGAGGATLDGLAPEQRRALVADTPLWFYVLREAELNGGRLGAVGGRIVAEVFHRALESGRVSILRDPSWRPTLGPDATTFRMVDLLLFAFENKAELLNPLGD